MARGAKHTTIPDNAVEARGLDKIYRRQGRQPEKHALKAVDLTVPRGSMFGLLGPNGAGKSTFINILAGLTLKTGGTVRVWGRDLDTQPRGARAAIGVVPQELSLDAFFTPREIMEVQAGLYGVAPKNRRTMEILDAVGLAEQADAYARSLSGGMQRRLLVAKALVHNPPVLVLDEPTAGVDIKLRQQLWSYVRDLNRQGTTIVLTTHYLEEAEELCDRIAIIDHGKVIACEPTRDLVGRLDHKALHLTVDRDLTVIPDALQDLTVDLVHPRQLMIRYRRSDMAIGQILSAVQASGLTVVDLATEEADLEDVFLELTRGVDGQISESQR
ncbi:MAG: ABC transporter ATP-binding protein [Alphaproteobacteria bacterium]